MNQIANDPAVIIKGLVTDPLRAGYQVLWNYENIYWRALVGNDIWGLYEVLRGFCRQGSAETSQQPQQADCWPKISTLAAILGLKERRVLTGYKKTIKGKTYYYQGWIEILQQHDLLIVPDPGHDTKAQYRFTVNLTPPLLTAQQVAQLPDTLQKKHQALVERCRQNLETLKAQRRPAKFAAPASQPVASGVDERFGKLPRGFGNLPCQFGNLPNKQQINNNPHKTTTTSLPAGEGSQPPPPATLTYPVVVALKKLGFKNAQAKKLAQTARQNDIDVGTLIAFMHDKRQRDPASVKDPKAWITTGIQRGYDLSAWQAHQAEQTEQVAKRQAQDQQQRQMEQALAQQRRRQQAQRDAQAHEHLHALRQRYHTTAREDQIWQTVLGQLKQQLSAAQFSFLAQSQLLSFNDESATICVHNAFIIQKITDSPALQRQVQLALADYTDHRQPIAVDLIDSKSATAT